MVIGKERTSWFSDHPPACTCADCQEARAGDRKFEVAAGGRKIGRNERCPCGSGTKYKKCHGAS